jgi:hypothetical protein
LPLPFSYDLGSDGFDSPSSALLGMPGFHFMPYGVRTPDSIMSTGSHAAVAPVSALHGGGGASSTDYSSLGYYGYSSGTTSSAMWRLPEDKLRIVKPLEGSLTLHHWQRLARPGLGNILEERSGIAIKVSYRYQFPSSDLRKSELACVSGRRSFVLRFPL